MSYRAEQSGNSSNGSDRHPMHVHHSIWMARWTRKSMETPNPISTYHGNMGLNQKYNKTSGLEAFESVKGLREIENRAFQGKLVASSSHMLQYGSDFVNSGRDEGKKVNSFRSRSAVVCYDTSLENEDSNRHGKTTLLAFENRSIRHTQAESVEKAPYSSGVKLFTSDCIASENTKLKKTHNNWYFLQKSPDCFHDVKSMKICQTTQSLLITNIGDVNLSKEHDVLRSTRAFMEFGRDSSNRPHGQQDLELKDGEQKGKNDSSTETDATDIDLLKKKNLFSGKTSTWFSKQAIKMTSNLPPRTRKRGFGSLTEIPDINVKIHELPDAEHLTDKAGPSSSRTQSLDMDVLLTRSNPSPDKSPSTDPTLRWVKRLKSGPSGSSSHSTKSLKLAENNRHEKAKGFLRGTSILGLKVDNHHGKKSTVCDKTEKQSRNSYVHLMKEGQDLVFSHSWVRRWMSSASTIAQKKRKSVFLYEPQSSRLGPENNQEKQFPSIAAMALMGKAVSCFRPCQFKKRGSLVFWNTGTI